MVVIQEQVQSYITVKWPATQKRMRVFLSARADFR